MKLLKALPVAIIGLMCASASFAADSGSYKIPAGDYLDQDVFLRSSHVVWREENGLVNLKYKLPKQIDGADPRWIELSSVSAAAPLSLTGPEGTADCTKVAEQLECTILYKKNTDNIFPINVDAAKAYVASRNYSAEKVLLMEKAQQSIMHEAAGVLIAKIRN
jgi:hypothetical protein